MIRFRGTGYTGVDIDHESLDDNLLWDSKSSTLTSEYAGMTRGIAIFVDCVNFCIA